jgi:hypothetical protein
MEILGKEKKEQKEQKEYYCEKCNFICCKKFNWIRHLMTSKHTKEIFGKEKKEQKEQKEQKENINMCICGKIYNNASGLWKHKQKCISNHSDSIKKLNENDKEDLIISLLKQNADLIKGQQDMMIKLTENGITNHSHNTTYTNSHNKAFNMNFFLNETCKNAMNITDFVESIKLQLNDLMEFGELGYVEGISKIIVKNLNKLDETERPIHCTDKKRETMYIKDENKWEKEDEKKSKLKKAINKIADKNIRLLPQFREKYPDYGNSSSKTSDLYNKMVIEVMETDNDKNDKIVRNISKATTIKDKTISFSL